MEIKTIWHQADYPVHFDAKVNTAMAEGWKLAKRELVVPPTTDKHIMLYAELVKLSDEELNPAPEPESLPWEEAVKVLRETCREATSCDEDECPAAKWCYKHLPEEKPADTPAEWRLPDEVAAV